MKTVLLTGAAGNLGLVVTRTFLEKGWHIHAATFSDREQSSLTLLDAGNHLSTYRANLANADEAQNYVSNAPGTISALVHLVGGINAGMPIEDTQPEAFENMLAMNMRSTFHILHYALPRLKEHGGAVVAIGAKAALHPEKNKSAYAAAKAGVISLILSAAEEGRGFGVRANVIVPSIIRTPANLEWAQNGEEKDWVHPQQIADAILFLCSDEGSGINGAVLPMYGGIAT